MKPLVGQSLVSTMDATTVIVIRAPETDVSITCGGLEMVDQKADRTGLPTTGDASQDAGALLGKRYADESVGLELLCTKGGTGTLSVNGSPLPLKTAKPLPASD